MNYLALGNESGVLSTLFIQTGNNTTICRPGSRESPVYHGVSSPLLYITLTSVISLLGVIGNIATISRVVTHVKFKGAFFRAFACLSFADLVSLSVYYLRIYVEFGFIKLASGNHIKEIFNAVTITVVHASAAHLVVVACFRYILLTHPLYFRCYIKPRTVIRVSVLCWIISVGMGTGYAFYDHAYYSALVNPQGDSIVQLSMSLYILFVPLSVFIFLHCLQLKALDTSLLSEKSKTKRKLSHMMFIIAFIYTACYMPFLSRNILIVLQESNAISLGEIRFGWIKKEMQHIATIFQVLNYSVNPIVYIFYSNTFGRTGRALTKHKRGHSEILIPNKVIQDKGENGELVRVNTWPTIQTESYELPN